MIPIQIHTLQGNHKLKLDAMLSQQIQAEEQKCLAENIRQIENNRLLEYQQTIPDPPLSNRHTDDQRPEKFTNKGRFENPNPKFTGFFEDQTNLNTDRVAGFYYNAHTKIVFENSSANQNVENENSLLNHRIQDYDQVTSPTPRCPTHRDNKNTSTPRITTSA